MAISRIFGQMLKDNLLRDGVNLAFDTDLLLLDVVNNRVGINNPTPSKDLSVTGDVGVSSDLDVVGLTTTGTANALNLTNTRITMKQGGILSDDAGLTFDTGTATLILDKIESNTNTDLTITADGSGIVRIIGTDGFSIPGGTTAQQPGSLVDYTLRFNIDMGYPEIWDGSDWVVVGPAAFAALTSQSLTGDGSTVVFTLNQTATAETIIVSINGVVQIPGDSYTVAGTSITFIEAPKTGDTAEVRFLSELVTVNAITNATGTYKVSIESGDIVTLRAASTDIVTISSTKIIDATNAHSIQLPVYTVATANALSDKATGQIIYVSDGNTGSPTLAVYNGSNWKVVALGATIST